MGYAVFAGVGQWRGTEDGARPGTNMTCRTVSRVSTRSPALGPRRA
jgi:hypothetical protein